MPENLGTAVLELTADDSQLKTDIDRAHKTVGQKMQSIGKTAMKTGGIMTAGLTVPIVAFGAKIAGVAGDFETQMNLLEVASGDAGISLDTLSEAAIAVGADTELVGINAAESADAMTEFYKAGLTTADIFGGADGLNSYLEEGASLTGAMRAAVDLAAASDLELAQSSELVSVAMATYGIDAEEATKITDNFVQAADASVTEVDQMAEGLANAGPVLASYGISLEDTNNMLALLSQRGIEGGEAGTALRSMFTNLQRPTDSVAEALDAANVELYDMEGNMREMPDIIGQFVAGTENMTEKQRNLTIQQAAGTYGMRALNTLMAEGTEGWEDMANATENAATAQDVATARTKGFEGAMETLMGVVETFMIQAGTPLIQDVLTPLVRDNLTPLVEKLTEIDPKFLKMGVVIAGVVAAAGPLIFILGAVVTALGAILSPIGLVVVGIGALIAIFVKANGGIQGTADKLTYFANWLTTNVWPMIQNVLNTITGFFQKKFGFIRDWIDENMGLIQATFQTVLPILERIWKITWGAILVALQTTWELIKGTINVALALITGILKAAMQVIQGDWRGAWTTIKETATRIFNAIFTMITNILRNILERFNIDLNLTWQAVLKWFTMMWQTISNIISTIRDFVTAQVGTTRDNVTSIFDNMRQVVTNIWNTLKAAGEAIFNALKTTIIVIVGLLLAIITGDWESAAAILEGIWNALKATAAMVWTAMKNAAVAIWSATKEAAIAIWEGLKAGVVDTISALRDALPAIWEGIKSAAIAVWEGLKEGVTGIIMDIYNAVTNMLDNVRSAISGFSLRGVGQALMNGLKNGIMDRANSIANAAADAVRRAIQAAKNAVGMGSPATEGIELGHSIMSGLAIGLGDLAVDVESSIVAPVAYGLKEASSLAGGPRRENHYNITVPQPIGNIGDLRNTLRLLEMATA